MHHSELSRIMSVAIASVAVAVASIASAQTRRPTPAPVQAEPSWYIGVGGGTSRMAKEFDSGFLATPGFTDTGIDQSVRTGTPFKLFAGTKFSQNLGVELGYINLGSFSAQRAYTAPATGRVDARARISGLTFDLVGWAPVAESFALFAKLGYFASNTQIDGHSTVTGVLAPQTKRRETNLHYGLGAQYNYTRALAFRAEWEMFKNVGNKNDYGFEANLQSITASALYRF